METLRKISTSIKEDANRLTLKRSKKPSHYFFISIALIAVLNFSIPLFTSGFTSCSSLFVNAISFIESAFFIDINDGQTLSPENIVKCVN